MPKLISLFSGAGGLDYGLEAAGFAFGAGVEMDSDSVSTLLESRPDWPVVGRSIFETPTQELLDLSVSKKGDVDLVAGGPPCQPFSKSGYWARGDARRLSDPRSDTLGAFIRLVRETLPRVMLVENVEGLQYAGKDEGLQLLVDELDDINNAEGTKYHPYVQVLNAADYGVPQLRERVFIVAQRDGRYFKFPEASHRPPSPDMTLLAGDDLETHRTAWDALGDVAVSVDEDLQVRGKWADLLPSIPEGCNYLHHTDRGQGLPLFGWRRRYWTFLLKLAKNRPSWTVQAQPGPAVGPFHWTNRRLSIRELSRLQTFPDNVNVIGGRTSAQRQLGNAVPSLLAEVVGRAIREQLLDSPVASPLKLLPPRRVPVPDPEPIAPVPERFRSLIGEHAAHPGTGRGHAAMARRSRNDDKHAELI
jgi:DNA (cytosine-5)-methyltransferase 1